MDSRVHNTQVLIIVFVPMFDLQDDRQITIEQEPLGNKEDPEDDSEDEHQKGYSGTDPVVWFILCFVFLLYSLLFLNFTMLH